MRAWYDEVMSIKSVVQLSGKAELVHRSALNRSASPVEDFGKSFQSVVDDLIDTMMHHDIAVGLAAPQIGYDLRVAAIHLKTEQHTDPLVIANPVIVSVSGKKDVKKESCMSVPHVRGPVERREKISITYQDRAGTRQSLAAHGFLARVISHEIDHLDGKLYTDRMRSLADLEPVEFFKKDSLRES